MKYLAFILSIYFLALNLVPCSDTGKTNDDTQVVSVVDFDGDHDQDCELCSPFCNCHCCHVHTIDFKLVAFEPFQPTALHDNFSHFDSLGKDCSHSLFQPPQV
ncbi:DUF6660 family protein [Flagellimonas pacifica]|uniref:Uncharacterized protein n=1 Tax=Flagellimonas pacifica TaxID=1247520 RepID=A0A285MXZ6_9FLAO|nr:DUF6660 family protein [Allomuricauda parva]SNZ01427.1 hypothetical protein SAMN06265377_3266 [Allomuricauda parva]